MKKKTVFTHPWKYCTGKFSSKGMIINRETRFEFFHYSRREGPYSTGIRASHEPVNQLNRYGPRSKVATIEGSATAISEASIITANHGWLSRPISIEDGWGRAEILIKWPMNYWHGWGGRRPLFRGIGEIKKKGRRGKKKKKKTTRRRNKMSAALVSCDAAAGNASAGTVYEQTARSAMCARFIPADRKRLSQWPIDG